MLTQSLLLVLLISVSVESADLNAVLNMFKDPKLQSGPTPAPSGGSATPAPSGGSATPAPSGGSATPAPSGGSATPAPKKGGLLANQYNDDITPPGAKELGYLDISKLRSTPTVSPTDAAKYLSEATNDDAWIKFKKDFDRGNYGGNTALEAARYLTFKQNVQAIKTMNLLAQNGSKPISGDINNFADKSPLEWAKANLNGVKFVPPDQAKSNNPLNKLPPVNANSVTSALTPSSPLGGVGRKKRTAERVKRAASVDWRDQGKVTPVKDQKECGACWAFASTGAMESMMAINGGALKQYSEQQLVDCSADYGSSGCDGGWVTPAFKYVKDSGQVSGADYPYQAKVSACAATGKTAEVKISGFETVANGDEDALADAVAKQPVASAIHMNDDLQHYKGGVYEAEDCPQRCDAKRCYLNHGVLIVGYGENDKDGKFWIVKNSWGTSWGESGYVRWRRGNNMCGIATAANYPKP